VIPPEAAVGATGQAVGSGGLAQAVKQEPVEPQLENHQQQPVVEEPGAAQQPQKPPLDLPPAPDRISDRIKGHHSLSW
jgi:hypothetical protein